MGLKPLPDLAGYRQLAVVSGDRFQLTRGEKDGDTTVLLKTFSSEIGSGAASDQLRREYELEQRLDHPNIAVAIDLVTDGRRPVLVLADTGGSTLRQVMGEGQISVRRALEIAVGIATGLAELHRHDIVHRNLNPEGVMVGDGGEVRIIDLSHATLVPRQQAAVIAPGVLRASLAYVSPEQTGRTSRLVDHRTDLYSLGIVLYEMLVGTVPFTAADPLELFHDHLAVAPEPVVEQRPQVPTVVSNVVDRLLEKDPEDRYRSAVGLVGDLQSILDRIVRGVEPDDLELRGAEISTRFQLPDQLFGRDDEVAQLEAWLEGAGRGENTLGFVHGYSGVGKTSLIEELRSSVNRRRGYQAVGKFDQLDRESAYGAVTAAFNDLLRQLLMEDDATIATWRQELRDVLGDGAGALVEVVPELSTLVGDVPIPEPLEATAARNRFHRLVSLFLSTIATPEHPTVIVLDDLQWADAATVDFIEALALEGNDRALLVVGAYRDNEVDESHPVHLLRQRLAAREVGFGDVELAALSHDAMSELVAASLRRTVADAAPLTDLSIRKTGCNPFFARIFLSALFEDGLLQLDPMNGAWSWDMEQVRARKLTDNMVELAMERIAGAGVAAQELLSAMAIIGIDGDAELLAEIQDTDPAAALRKLASLDLVLLTEGDDAVRWQFAHDRIQEAASSRLDDEAALRWHRRIGAALEHRWEDGHAGASIFSVLRHLNAVAATNGSQDRRLAEMNLEGGAAAMRATAYDAAQRYFTMGVELLGSDQWDTDPDTAYELHLGAADAARLALRFDEMKEWLDVIDRSTTDTEQRVKAVVLRLLYLTYAVRSVETVDVARAELAKLGWKLAADPSLPAVIAGLTRTRMAVSRHSIEDLEQLPVMTDITAQAIVRLLNQSVASAYWSNPKVMALMIQKAVQLSVRYGNDPASALFWASYGMVLAGIVGKPEQGIGYADLAVRLADRFGARAQPGGVRFTRDALVAPATTPLREIEPSLERSYTVGLEYGEIGFAMAAYFFLSLHRLVSGAPLDTLARQLDSAVALMQQHAAVRNLDQPLALRQFVHDMQVGPAGGGPFTGPHLDGDSHTDSTDKMTIAWTHTFRAMSRFHFGDAVGAYEDIVAAGPYLDAMLGQALVPVHHLYGVLAASAAASAGDAGARRVARKHRKSLAWWARHNPVDYAAALLLADGALAAADGKAEEAKRLLGDASSSAQDPGVPWIAALSASLVADVEEREGDTVGSARNRDRAIVAYRTWGAWALVGPDAGEEGAQMRGATDAQLDLDTVIRAAEAISEEIELGALLRRLLGVAMRNAGAERGVLFRIEDDVIIPEAEGRFVSGEAEITVCSAAGEFDSGAAESVLRLVTRTGEPVISDRAMADPVLGTDDAIRARGVRSLLCLPLINQGRLQGVLYLENNRVDGAFTPERYRLLRVLSAQAASALEKARLLDAQARLIEAQHRFVPEEFLKTLGSPNLFDVELGEGTTLELDIMFTDIRRFTSIIERMQPDQAMEFVNSYLAHMEPVIHEHGGFVADYEGDAILALFDERDSEAAVLAGIAMAAAERADNEQRAVAGLPPVHTGFGINTDFVMLGVVGGANSFRATIVGDAANLASRIENLTKRYSTRMIIAENTAKRLGSAAEITLRPLERVQVVGKTEPALVFEVLDALDPADRDRRLASLEAYRLAHAAYERSEFEEARARFGDIVASDDEDGPAKVMLDRVEELLAAPGPITGPPITRLESK